MGTKINIAELEPGQLNSECITIITMFARELEVHSGAIIQLTEKHVLREIIRHAHNAPSTKLEALYDRLKVAIKKFINSEEFDLSQHEANLVASNIELNVELSAEVNETNLQNQH